MRSALPSGKFAKTGRPRGLQAFAPLRLSGSAFRLPIWKVLQDWKAAGTSGIRAVEPRRLCVPPSLRKSSPRLEGHGDFRHSRRCASAALRSASPSGKTRQHWRAAGISGIRTVAPRRQCVPPSHRENSPRLEGHGDFRHSRRCASAALRSAFPSGKFSKTGRLRGLQAFAPLSFGGFAFFSPMEFADSKTRGIAGTFRIAPLHLGGSAFRPPIGKIRQDWKATGTSGIRAVELRRLCVSLSLACNFFRPAPLIYSVLTSGDCAVPHLAGSKQHLRRVDVHTRSTLLPCRNEVECFTFSAT